jgi:hypothetical protein
VKKGPKRHETPGIAASPKPKDGQVLLARKPALAPELARKRIQLPKEFPAFIDSGNLWMESVLNGLGLSEKQHEYMWFGFAHLPKHERQLARFDMIPRNRRLPQLSGIEGAGEDGFADLPDVPAAGIFYFDVRIWMAEPTKRIERDFRSALRRQKRLWKLGFLRPDKADRGFHFKRDLVVYTLYRAGMKSVNELDIQLHYMGLPLILDGASKADPDTAKRDILRRFRILLREVRESPLFAEEE